MNKWTVEQKLQVARFRFARVEKFYASFLYGRSGLKFRENPQSETFATDGIHIFYNPEFVKKLTVSQIMGVIKHEILHCVMLHFSRIKSRDRTLWNIATDFTINESILKDSNQCTLPPNCMHNVKYKNKSSEQIYQELLNENRKTKNEIIDKYKNGGNIGEVIPAPSKNEEGELIDENDLVKEWERKVATAVEQSQFFNKGNIPCELEHIVNKILYPKVSWKILLQQFITQFANNDYNFMVPNRRFISQGLIMPSLHNMELGQIVIALDTSGSMMPFYEQLMGELSSILELASSEMIVLHCDAAVDKVEYLQRADLPLVPAVSGGGGTSFKPAFEWVDKNGIEPACMVYITDTHGHFPNEEPDYPVLWVDISKYSPVEPPFGEFIKVED